MKFCSKCQTNREFTDFHKYKASKDGLTYECKFCSRARVKQWRLEKPLEAKLSMKKWQSENRDKVNAIQRRWEKKNPGVMRAKNAQRRCAKLNATPSWADLEAIKEFYKNCPEGYHVDHIIPLQGETACGLHILENLQYLPAIENLRKGNKYPDPDNKDYTQFNSQEI